MAKAGLRYTGPIHADGKLHRFKAEGDRQRNGWYVLYAGPPCAGAFGCWKRGIKESWCEKPSRKWSDAEWAVIRKQWARADKEREAAEAERHAKARKETESILKRSTAASSNHSYLACKGVKPFGELREHDGNLVLPLRDASGELHSLQCITINGTKRFHYGGRVGGCFFTISDLADGPLVITEGYATGASVHEAAGNAVVCAMNCGNLLAVAQALRRKWPNREIVIAADNDQFTEGNPGLTKATEAAKAIAAKLAVPKFKNTASRRTDFNDLHQREGSDIVKKQLEAAMQPAETDQECYERLAKLPPADYDRCRQDEAGKLGIRPPTLDDEVKRRRTKEIAEGNALGQKIAFESVVSWPDPVDGGELLDELFATLRRFVVMGDDEAVAAALFVVHTFAFDLSDISPILFVTGPTKRCGKTVLVSVLSRMVNCPLAASATSAAGLYRVIELHRPTLLIDEVDAFLKGDEQLRGLINSGHTRDAAFFISCVKVGDDYEPRRWSTWAPKVFSGIGRLADTIEDRAVILKMRRKLPSQRTEKLRRKIQFADLRSKSVRFVAEHADAIRSADPAVPDELNDRAADNWSVLLAIADLCGPVWAARARQAALALSGLDAESRGDGAQLLADIAQCFDSSQTDRFSSKELCARLAAIEDRPWAEYGKARREISANQLASLLREFGVFSRNICIGDTRPKGYLVGDFSDAFCHYIPEGELPKRYAATSGVNAEGSSLFQTATSTLRGVSEIDVPANNGGASSGVADHGASLVAYREEAAYV
jgi:putative DNA primase/helicase